MAKSGEHLTVNCIVCKKQFRQSRFDQQYCGRACYYSVWKLKQVRFKWKIEKNCEVCSKLFTSEHPNQKHCSEKCTYEKRKTTLRNGKGKGWSRGLIFVEKKMNQCKECGGDFYSHECYKKRGKNHGTFCSKSCKMINFVRNRKEIFPGKNLSRGLAGKRKDLDDKYFRSRWEANYARYLNFLVKNGEILKWEYEVDTFEFFEIKKGTRFYTPDFKVYSKNGEVVYHEVKGWMDNVSKTRAKRMDKYYPKIKIIIIGHEWFKKNGQMLCKILPNWEKAISKSAKW